jgi:hypothetical protein
LVFVLLGVTSLGCPGTLEDPARFADGGGRDAAGCPDVPQAVFVATCATKGCHNPTDDKVVAQGLDLESPGLVARLVGMPAKGGPGLLIDPASPPSSVVYSKLTSAPPFGARMPFGKAPLDDATIACVLAWITEQVSDAGLPEAGSLDAGAGGPDAVGDSAE